MNKAKTNASSTSYILYLTNTNMLQQKLSGFYWECMLEFHHY